MVARQIAGDANGYPWVAIDATSNPLYKRDTTHNRWTFGFNSGPVYDLASQSYVRIYIFSDPQVHGRGIHRLLARAVFRGMDEVLVAAILVSPA